MSVATEVRGPKCPECGNGVVAPFTSREEFDYDLGDKIVHVVVDDVPLQRCTHCHLEASGSQAAKVRHDAVCRAAGYPTPAEQKAIREQLGWSQQDLADLTGYGVATVSRSERGRLLANRSYYRTLLAVRDCPAFRDYLERVSRAEREPRPATPPGDAGRVPQTAPPQQRGLVVQARAEFRATFRALNLNTARTDPNKSRPLPRTRVPVALA